MLPLERSYFFIFNRLKKQFRYFPKLALIFHIFVRFFTEQSFSKIIRSLINDSFVKSWLENAVRSVKIYLFLKIMFENIVLSIKTVLIRFCFCLFLKTIVFSILFSIQVVRP